MEKRCRRAVTAHVGAPGAAARMTETPFRKGSVLEDGKDRTTWVGASMVGRKATAPRVRLVAGLNDSARITVNSPHRKKPAKADFMAARKEASLSDVSPGMAAQRRCRMSSVMGSFGLRSRSPWYRLIPRMSRCTTGASHTEKGRSASTCKERTAQR